MNFSGISNKSFLGKALRFPLQLIPAETVVPVLQGRLRGKKWIVGSSHHGCWLGSYEDTKRRYFERTLKQGSIVYDIGANVGFYTLLASVLVGTTGKVFAFEPAPRNLRYLRAHLRLNLVENVRTIEAAVSDRVGVAHFDEASGPCTGRLAEGGELLVRTVSVDELFSIGELPPANFIKVNVEGSEARVLRGAKNMLSVHRPTIFLATHGKETHAECCQLLRSLGYRLEPLGGTSLEETDEVTAFGESPP